MNHIFKIKFNPQKGTSCVCSELAKQKGKNKVKVTGLATAALLLSPSVYSNSTWNGEHFINTIDNKYLSSTQNSYDIAVDSARNYVTGNNQTLMSHSGLGNKTLNYNNNINYTGNNLQLLNNTGGTNVNYLSPVSIISQKLSPTTTDKLLISNNAGIVKFLESVSIDSTYNFASDQPTNRTLTSKDKNGGYNTAVSVRGTGATEAKTIFNTLSVNLKDHSQGVNKCMYSIGSFCIINSNGLVTGSGNFGLRVAKSGEAKNKAETSVTVENLFDFTSIGDRSLGIYISGNKGAAAGDSGSAKVILNHSNFLQKASSEDKNAFTGFWDSHAIKLGRGRDGEGNGILISTGNMNINTTEVVEGGGIKILGNSQLLANSDTSSTSIKTKGYALEIGGVDDQNGDLTFDFATSKDITAAFNNAVFTTTGTSGDPRIATNQQSDVIFNNSLVKRGELRKDLIFVDQGQQNVQLRFSGNNTNLTAHKDGYILNVSGNYKRDGYRFFNTSGTLSNYDAVNASTVNFIATDSGSMTGLIYKGNIKSGENAQKLDIQKQPKINIDLSNGFIWNLQQSGDKTIALFDNLIIRDGAIIHGATKTGNSKFTLKAQTLDSNNKTILGTITNDSATITLVNGKYNDLLTLDGNYIGVNNAVVKLDSRWNTPGGESGENFESDSIYISGTATGSTKVIPVKQDNTEGYFEGDIISIVNKTLNSLPVITVNKDNNDSELAAIFNGKAATNGIGLANLMSRLNANNQREYYWSLINPTVADDTPPTATTPVDTAPTTPPTATTPVDTAPTTPPTVTTPSVSGKPNNSYGWENLSLKESIPALVVTPAINLEQIADTTPRYNQRFNSHNSIQLNSGNEIWVYYLNKDMDKDGRKRFRSTSNADNLQIGYNSIDNKSSLFLSYSNIDTKFYDQKIKEQYTGKVHSNILNVALSKAFSFNQERSYFDIINQLTYLNNKYEIKDGSKATQKGYAASLSTELGHHFYLDEGRTISISPQTQLMYTRLNLKHMKLDNFTQVASHNLDSLQLRVGARIAIIQDYLKVSTELNIHKQLLNDPRIHIGPDVVQEKYSKTRGEIYTELGVKLNKNHSLQIGNSLSLSLKDKNSKIYGVKLGYSYAW